MNLYCPKCREINAWGSENCARCGVPLRGREGETYLEKLIWALHHPEAATALRSATILGKLKAVEAVDELEGVLGDSGADPYVRAAAARSLGAIGEGRARSTLVEALEHAPISVRLAAVEALEALGLDGESFRILQRTSKDRSPNLRGRRRNVVPVVGRDVDLVAREPEPGDIISGRR